MLKAPAVLVLAAGQGTRMKSGLPKVLHSLMGWPLIAHVLNSARYLAPELLVVVTGHQAHLVEAAAEDFHPTFVLQEKQLGTGHAVGVAKELLADCQGPILIMPGDAPLISPQTLMDFLAAHRALEANLSVLTVEVEDPAGYGRVVRDEDGWLARIVETRDTSEEEAAINEINTGLYLAEAGPLFEAIDRLCPNNQQQEYYLTDIVADLRDRQFKVAAICGPDPYEVQGINDRFELAKASLFLKARINQAWMKAGVTMLDPSSAYIETGVKLAPDVLIYPQTVLTGQTMVGEGAEIGAFCQITDSRIRAGAQIGAGSVIIRAEVDARAVLPPHTVINGPGELAGLISVDPDLNEDPENLSCEAGVHF